MTTEQSKEVAQYTPGSLSIQKPRILLAVVQERYPELDDKAALLFCYHCMRMGLDPLLNEIYPTVFTHHKTGKQVLVPIISEMGMGSLAARACSEAWNGPPSVVLVTDAALKEAICGDRDAWVWEAKGRRKDWEPGREYSTYGWMTKAQAAAAKEKKKPSGELPGNQARVRAIKRWLMEAYPEASTTVRAVAQELQAQAEGVQEALSFIEAEYTIDGKVAKALPAAAPHGVCPIHNIPLVQGKFSIYCPTKVPNGKGELKFCKGIQQESAATQQVPDTQPPSEDELDDFFGVKEEEPISKVWDDIRALVKELKVTQPNLQKWWGPFGVTVIMDDFLTDQIADKFKAEQLISFRFQLQKLQEKRSKRKSEQPGTPPML